MPTVTSTPGGASDNSYVTEAQANAYFADGLRNDEWNSYSDELKQRAVIDATDRIERLGGKKSTISPARALFPGIPYDTSTPQALHFPRSGDTTTASAVVIVEDLRDAVCEQAIWQLGTMPGGPLEPLIDAQGMKDQGITNSGQDGIAASVKQTDIPAGIAPRAWELVMKYVQVTFSATVY